PMSEGAHRVDLIAPDWTGNTATETWVFTIKTSSPKLVLDNPSEDMTYVNDEMFMVRGTVEVGSALVLKGLATDGLEIEGDGSFRAMVTLSEGENTLEMVATDVVGNSYKIQRDIILDTDVPDISSIRSSEGYITNTDTTSIQGKVSERGNMYINYVPVVVNSDGTFSGMVALNEGINTFHVQFEDYAGNYVDEWMNITRDSISPVIEIDIPTTVDEEIINITGKIIDGYSVKINGKIPSTETTRDGDIEFTKSLALSHGINTIVIEAVDEAGNVIELSYTLEYKKDYGTNYAAIGVMIALLIVGLVVGLFIAMGLWKERPEEEEVEPSEDIPVDEEGEEIEPDGELPEDMEAGEVEDADIEAFDETPDMDDEPAPDIDEDMIDGEEELTIVEHGDDVEAIPMEEGLPEEIESDVVEPSEEPMVEEAGEDVVEEPMPEEGTIEEAPDIEEVPEAEDIPEEGAIKEASDMEEAPKADETPEEGPDADDVEMDDTPDEVPEEDIKEASDIEDAPEAEDIPKAEPVADEPVAVDDVPEAPVEDEKIQRLKKAYEDGKISEELYEKNLAKLQGKE
ncbi:MAG: hypothetical protein KAS67_01320, partial [Thermoplasmata archaeon]|nr:hypothetical protein [Thermoplasmata archaeon]